MRENAMLRSRLAALDMDSGPTTQPPFLGPTAGTGGESPLQPLLPPPAYVGRYGAASPSPGPRSPAPVLELSGTVPEGKLELGGQGGAAGDEDAAAAVLPLSPTGVTSPPASAGDNKAAYVAPAPDEKALS
jgi:hypothetical protein